MTGRGAVAGLLCAAALAVTALTDPADAQQRTPERKRVCEAGRIQLAKLQVSDGVTLPKAINKPLTAKPGSARRGLEIAVDPATGNCVACHHIAKVLGKVDEADPDSVRKYGRHGELGQPLNGVGGRFSEGELRLIVADPAQAFPDVDTAMPAYHIVKALNDVHPDCRGRPILSVRQVEDVVAFLRTLK